MKYLLNKKYYTVKKHWNVCYIFRPSAANNTPHPAACSAYTPPLTPMCGGERLTA